MVPPWDGIMCLHLPLVWVSFFPIQQRLKEETTERRFSGTFLTENQKGIQEKQLPFCLISDPSRAGLGRET